MPQIGTPVLNVFKLRINDLLLDCERLLDHRLARAGNLHIVCVLGVVLDV